jgi:hypothetical protein
VGHLHGELPTWAFVTSGEIAQPSGVVRVSDADDFVDAALFSSKPPGSGLSPTSEDRIGSGPAAPHGHRWVPCAARSVTWDTGIPGLGATRYHGLGPRSRGVCRTSSAGLAATCRCRPHVRLLDNSDLTCLERDSCAMRARPPRRSARQEM